MTNTYSESYRSSTSKLSTKIKFLIVFRTHVRFKLFIDRESRKLKNLSYQPLLDIAIVSIGKNSIPNELQSTNDQTPQIFENFLILSSSQKKKGKFIATKKKKEKKMSKIGTNVTCWF